MSLAPFIREFRTMLGTGLRLELRQGERLLSPILFALTVLVLFAFAVGEVPREISTQIYVAASYLTALFALQISFSRIFEADQQDQVFDLLRTLPLSPSAWFSAKFLLVFLLGCLILLPTVLFGGLLLKGSAGELVNPMVLMVAALALVGLSALGVLLSTMMLRASGRQILYPLLYFPLTTPVLIAAVNASLAVLQGPQPNPDFSNWVSLLVIFDVLYFTLGILLFGELVNTD